MPRATPPLYEYHPCKDETIKDTLNLAVGKVLKVLSTPPPAEFYPEGVDVKFIWMSRDWLQQAKSQKKYVEKVLKREFRRPLIEWIAEKKSETVRKLAYLQEMGDVLNVDFDFLRENAGSAMSAVENFLDVEIDVDAAVSCIRERPRECLPNFLEEEIWKEATGREDWSTNEMIRWKQK